MEDKWISENELLKRTELSEKIIIEWIEKNNSCTKNKNGISLINLKYFLDDYPEFIIDFSNDTNIGKKTAENHDSIKAITATEKAVLIIKKYIFHIIIIIVLIIMIFNHFSFKNRLIKMQVNYSSMMNKRIKKISLKEMHIENRIHKLNLSVNSRLNSSLASINSNLQKINRSSEKIDILQKQVTENKKSYNNLCSRQIQNNINKINNLSSEVNMLQNNMEKLTINKKNKEIVLPNNKLPIVNE